MNADLNRFGAPGAFLNRLVLGFHFGCLVFWTTVPDLGLGLGAALAAAAAAVLLLAVVVLPEETTFFGLEEEDDDDDDDGEVEVCFGGI